MLAPRAHEHPQAAPDTGAAIFMPANRHPRLRRMLLEGNQRMTLRKIVGALIMCAIFTMMAVAYSVASGYWWVGPLVLLAGFALAALLLIAVWLITGGDR